MIVIKCDLCNKKYNHINSLVLYSREIDYCDKCLKKIEKIQEEFKREIKYQEVFFDSALRNKEKQLIKKYKGGENEKRI